MKTSTKAIIVTLYLNLFIAFNATSQEWVDLLQLPNSTYDQIVQSGDNYYNSNPELISIKGSGYKDFQRYKWYWKNRIAGTNNITEHNQRLADFRLSLANNSSLRTSNTINSDWKNLGPFNTPEFGNDGSSGNGWVSTIFVDRTTQKIKYCGSVTGGFWYLNENTNSWSPSNLNTFTFGVLDIEEDYINPDIVYISLGTEINFRQNGFGIWRSTDKGRNFTQISSPDIEPMEMVKKIRISPLNPNLMYATSVYGIYVYNIANDVWTTLYKNTNDAQFFDDIDFHLTNQNIVYFSGRKIMYTTDNGSTVVDFPYEFQSKYTSEIDLQKVNDAHNDFRFNNVESDGITFLSTNHGLIIPYMGNWLQEPAPISNVDGTWKASTYNNNSVASIKQRPNVNSPKLKLLISGYMYIDEIYNLELFAKIPVGCGIKINLKSTLNANQQIIYDSGIISSSFEGIIRTSSFNIIDELYTSPDITNDNISLYIEIEAMVNSNMYNQNDEMIIDNLSILKKIFN